MKLFLKIFYRTILFSIVVYMGYSFIFNDRGLKSYLKLKDERIKLEKLYEKTTLERDRLAEELAALQKDPLYLEEQIKINLSKGKKGEVYYLFSENEVKKKNESYNPNR